MHPPQIRKSTHKAAEQKRRDSLKTTFDELRGLLPPIPLPSTSGNAGEGDDGGGASGVASNVGGSGSGGTSAETSIFGNVVNPLLPGALPPRGPPKAGAEGPNKSVSKLQLLICGNEYIKTLKGRVERRDDEIGRLRQEVRNLRQMLGLVGNQEVQGMESGGQGGGYGGQLEGGPYGMSMENLMAQLELDLGLDLDKDIDEVEQTGSGTAGGEGDENILPIEDDEDEYY